MGKVDPVIKADFPEPDVIRVEDTYYMLSTTMHFRPGAVILRSYDLLNWEIVSHVFDSIDDTREEHMVSERTNYGRGMWGGCIRYHAGKFYVCFAALETDKTYIYAADSVQGPWNTVTIEGYCNHPSLLFDEDGRVYLVYGYEEIFLRELREDLSGFKVDGLKRTLIQGTPEEVQGYEGSCIQKINGKYYFFVVYWSKIKMYRRVQMCYISDSLEGEFVGEELLCDDIDYYEEGIAQVSLIETQNGKWYAMMYQYRGAVGRMSVLAPVIWNGDRPLLSTDKKMRKTLKAASSRPNHNYIPIYTSDNFEYSRELGSNPPLKLQWEWNHCPEKELWRIGEQGGLILRTGKVCANVVHAANILTQRMMWPKCAAEVTVDASRLKTGDVAGLCALQGCYGLIGITREYGSTYLVVIDRQKEDMDESDNGADYMPGNLLAKVKLSTDTVRLRINVDFRCTRDKVEFLYQNANEWEKVGGTHKLVFKMDHFAGCRFGLFVYATSHIGGEAMFRDFQYIYEE